jgi:hypothetical protein
LLVVALLAGRTSFSSACSSIFKEFLQLAFVGWPWPWPAALLFAFFPFALLVLLQLQLVLELVSNHPELQRRSASCRPVLHCFMPADLSLHLPEPNMHVID